MTLAEATNACEQLAHYLIDLNLDERTHAANEAIVTVEFLLRQLERERAEPTPTQ